MRFYRAGLSDLDDEELSAAIYAEIGRVARIADRIDTDGTFRGYAAWSHTLWDYHQGILEGTSGYENPLRDLAINELEDLRAATLPR